MKLPFNIGNRPIQGNFDALMKMLQSRRTVSGVVSLSALSASILEGSGFSVTHNGAAGDVTITFNPAFADRPSFVGMVVSGARAVTEHPSSPANGSQIRLTVFTTSTGAGVDAPFHFIAKGP